MIRRPLLAVLVALSMTLTGVASCESILGDEDECDIGGEWCAPNSCCSGMHCTYLPNVDDVAVCRPI